MRKRPTRTPGPDSLSQSLIVAAAADRLTASPGRAWRQVTATHAREATIHGGGRAWTLRCSVRLEGVEGGRFLASVVLWTGDPEAPRPTKATPALLEFVAKIQRRLRGMGFSGRFQPALGGHWPGSFSRWFRGLETLDRTLAGLDRLERSLGAVVPGTESATG